MFGYLFEALAKLTVYGAVDPRNHASIRLLETVGMQKESRAGDNPWYNSKFDDDIVFALPVEVWHVQSTRT